jgi:DNA-binding NtrC family response regulator
MTSVLIVEDDPKIRATLLFQLREEGFAPEGVTSAENALQEMKSALPDLLILDVRLPGMSGVELVHQLVKEERLPPTVIISGEASISETVEALQLGVHEFIEKPFSKERLLRSITNTLEHDCLRQRVAALETELGIEREILGDSEAICRLREQITRVALTDARVLVRGESGTGKELIADALHRGSSRSERPFVKVNCAALPPHLIEDELFGHLRGAFTDARRDKPGLFEVADGGTLFLDEIGDMELALQSRLLRVLEDGKVRRLGDTRERTVNVRIVTATHADLEAAVGDGRFREDLYFRLAHVPLEVPPLRERAGDISLLFKHFLRIHCRRQRRAELGFESTVLEQLERLAWPGNVRELSNLCERLVIFAADPVTVEQLPERYRIPATDLPGTGLSALEPSAPILPLRELRSLVEREYIERVLHHTAGNITEAAKLLDLQRSYLYEKMAKLGLRP